MSISARRSSVSIAEGTIHAARRTKDSLLVERAAIYGFLARNLADSDTDAEDVWRSVASIVGGEIGGLSVGGWVEGAGAYLPGRPRGRPLGRAGVCVEAVAIIGAVVGLLGVLVPLMLYLHGRLAADMTATRAELRGDVAEVRRDLHAEATAIRADLHALAECVARMEGA